MKTATRPAPADVDSLSAALAASTALTKLHAFARAVGCDPLDLSADAGKSLSLPHIVDAMRRRGYAINAPRRPQQQLMPGHVVWHVAVQLPHCGPSVTLAIATPKAAA